MRAMHGFNAVRVSILILTCLLGTSWSRADSNDIDRSKGPKNIFNYATLHGHGEVYAHNIVDLAIEESSVMIYYNRTAKKWL